MPSYRHDVQKNGSALSFVVGEKVIWELVYCWGERKCQSHHTSAVWQRGTYTQPNPRGLCDFKMGVHLRKIGLGCPVASAGSVTALPSLTSGLSNTTKVFCIPENRARQLERAKCKFNSSLWSSSIKSWKGRKHQGLNVQNTWNSSTRYLIIFNLQYITLQHIQWLHICSLKKTCKASCISSKASAILRAWTHTQLKQAGRKTSHAEDSSSRAPAGTQCDHGTTIRLRSLGIQPLHSAPAGRQKQSISPMGPSICGEWPLSDLPLSGPGCRLISSLGL